MLKKYNELEDMVIEKSQSLIADNISLSDKNKYRSRILQVLKILEYKEIISRDIRSDIDEIRRYINYDVRGSNK